ncbi:hypothetical protein J2S50_000010 [Streptomyces sp. DSM 40167]|nr:hypothetical protein [Streptomyces sp. DSM 40167]
MQPLIGRPSPVFLGWFRWGDLFLKTVSRPRAAKGFVVLARLRKVERTLGWIMKAGAMSETRNVSLSTPKRT